MYFGEEKNPLPEGRWGKSTVRLQASMHSTHKLHPHMVTNWINISHAHFTATTGGRAKAPGTNII
jgi:hypothetical protein